MVGRAVLLLTPVCAGVALLLAAAQGREPPARTDAAPLPQPAAVVVAAATPFTPRVVGHGLAEPARTWRAVVRVGGVVESVADNLDVGALLPAGTEIARIETADYAAALARAEADEAAARAELDELRLSIDTTAAMREIESAALDLREADAKRLRELFDRGAASASARDEAARSLLTQRARLQEIDNTLALLPARIRGAEARAAAAAAQTETAGRDLARARLILPFDASVAEADVEPGEFVAAGATLARFDGADATEIVAQIPQDAFARFVAVAGRDPDAWRAEATARIGGETLRWPARVLRLSDGVDLATRTVGVVVGVNDPYSREADADAALPPLPKGAFIRVELSGAPLPARVVAPLAALRNGAVYIADAENRLRIRDVSVLLRKGSRALLAQGDVAPGERMVVGELSPAVEGMRLAPVAEAGAVAALDAP